MGTEEKIEGESDDQNVKLYPFIGNKHTTHVLLVYRVCSSNFSSTCPTRRQIISFIGRCISQSSF